MRKKILFDQINDDLGSAPLIALWGLATIAVLTVILALGTACLGPY